jgi:hypothetical protein
LRYDKIDILKSKQKERVIRKTWLIEPILDFLTYVVLVGAYPFISGLFFFDQLEKGDYLVGASILFALSLILGGLLLYSIINLDRLKRISGTLKERDRETIKTRLELTDSQSTIIDSVTTLELVINKLGTTNSGYLRPTRYFD